MGKNETEEQGRGPATQWAELMGQLFDRLTGKGAVVSYGSRTTGSDIR